MSLRFQSQLAVDLLPDSQSTDQWEVVMPTLQLTSNQETSWTSLAGLANNLSGGSYTPVVEEITFGVRNFKSDTRRVRTGWCNVPSDIENYQDVSITMFCSSGMLTQYYLDTWKSLVFNEEGEYYNTMAYYKKNIEVYFYGTANAGLALSPIAHYTLVGCWPSQQDSYKLSYDDNPKRLRILQIFKCDKIVIDKSYKTSSIIKEMVTAPSSIVDNAISSLTNTISPNSDYNVTKTYS